MSLVGSGMSRVGPGGSDAYAAQDMVTADPNVTYERIQEELNNSSGIVHSILHDALQLRKLCARWIPHATSTAEKCQSELPQGNAQMFDHGRYRDVSKIITGDESWFYHYDAQTKQQSRQWCEVGEGPPMIVRKTQYTETDVRYYFNTTGDKSVVPLQPGETINSTWSTKSCLPEVIDAIHEQRPGTGLRGTFLHHDNASSHNSKRTRQFIEESGLHILPNLPYSPDLRLLAISKNKKYLKGKKFDSNSEVAEALNRILGKIEENEFKKAMKKWFVRMKRCIEINGAILSNCNEIIPINIYFNC